jgi:hypothetical protein
MRWLRTPLFVTAMMCIEWHLVSDFSVAGVVLGQVDNFQDGTRQNWTNGPVSDPVNISTGGPAGAGDRFLEVASGTFGGGSHLVTFNQTQWIGNYISAGVNRIEMDLANFGASTLDIRVALRSSAGGSGTPGYSSTNPFALPADAQWHRAVFPIDSADLTAINSPAALSTFLTSVGDARILSSLAPSLVGDGGNNLLGVDNILAVRPGDLNHDNFVGQGDLNLVLGHWGQSGVTGGDSQGDWTGDGFVGQADLNAVLGGWGQGTPPSGSVLAPVPEPSTAVLATIACGILLLCRKRLG